MEFMLAKPLRSWKILSSLAAWIVEDKYDGIRSQVHYQSGYVRIYSRRNGGSHARLPREIKSAFEAIPGNGLVDGEIFAWRDGRKLNSLQRPGNSGLARKKRVRSNFASCSAGRLMAYDMLLLQYDRLLFACSH